MKKTMALLIIAGVMCGEWGLAQQMGGPGPRRDLDRPHLDGGRRIGGGDRQSMAGIGRLLKDPAAAREIGLSEEEVAEIREVTYRHNREMIAMKAKAELAKVDLNYLKSQRNADHVAIEQAIEEVGTIETEAAKARFRHREQLKSILGEERLQQIAHWAGERRQERMEGSRERSGPKRGRRGKGSPHAGAVEPQ